MRDKRIILILFILSFLLSACSLPVSVKKANTSDSSGSDLFDNLIRQITHEFSAVAPDNFSSGQGLLITTFVDLNDFKKTTAFGRLLAERLMTAMGDLDYNVVEIRRGSNIYVIEDQGEMILTRRQDRIPDKIQAGAIIYGTYVAVAGEVLVTARMARSSDFWILKSYNGRIPKTPLVEELLRGERIEEEEDEIYERIPVNSAD